MSDSQLWQESNAHYLSIALTWLRLLLERKAQSWQDAEMPPLLSAEPAPSPQAPSQSQKQGFLRRSSSQSAAKPASSSTPALSKKPEPITDEQINEQATALAEAEAESDVPSALLILSKQFGLSRFEREVLLLCIAMELDPHIASLCTRAQRGPNRPYPTFALALALFDDPRWDVLSPQRPLRYWRLIEIHQPGAEPLTTSALSADERIVSYVKGLNYLDHRLSSLVAPLEIESDQALLPPSQAIVVDSILRSWYQAITMGSSFPIIQLVGSDAPGKHLVAAYAAAQFGRHLYRIPLELLPLQAAELETLARLWQRESHLLPLALYLDAQEIDGSTPGEGLVAAANRFLALSEGLHFLGVRETWPRLGHTNLALDVARPAPAEQEAAWAGALEDIAPDSPALLASQFNLDLATIQRIARAELDEVAGERDTLPERLWRACLLSVRPRLDSLAQRLDPRATWDDIVLPDEETRLLQQIADQVAERYKVYESWGFASKMNRGLGISALFAGESGTGKTMAAEVIANALHLNLYRIDLSAVVSKYIGETEKNLRRLFDAAEDGGAILFFDEADALFGKRQEVKDSHDRYANIEIDYLLQRVEAYRGLAILATNMKSALDNAFLRRLRFIVSFPFPGIAERKLIWQKVFPEQTPREPLDYERLARFNLTGGSIHNIALNAAFLAAREGKVVDMWHILQAARNEFRKLERPINEAEFRWQTVQGVRA